MTNPSRILVAEDDSLVRMVMVDILTDAGFEVFEAADGDEACRLVHNPDHIDLIVTDLNMPGADGVTVAQCARRQHTEIPVLFVSGRPDLIATLPFPVRFLPKPFNMQQLTTTVSDMLAKAKR